MARLLLASLALIGVVPSVAVGGGFPPTVVNVQVHAGTPGAGMTFRGDGNDQVIIVEPAAGLARVYDVNLVHPPASPPGPATIPAPAIGASPFLGIAWNPNDDHLYWLNLAGVLAETLSDGTLVQSMQLFPGAGIDSYGDLCVDAATNTIWVCHPAEDVYRNYQLDGSSTGIGFSSPAGVGAYGFSLARRFDTKFDLPVGQAADPGVVDLSVVDETGAIVGATIDLSTFGAETRGIASTAVGSDGTPSIFIYEAADNRIYELNRPSSGSPCDPPTALFASTNCAASTATCLWDPSPGYDAIQVQVIELIGGSVVDSATLAGGATQWVSGPLVGGMYEVRVAGICGGITGSPAVVTYPHTASLEPIDNVIVDTPGTEGMNDSAELLFAVLGDAGKDYLRVESLSQLCPAEFTPGTIVWVFQGVYPASVPLSVEDGTTLVEILQNGGSLYVEGSDIWGSDPPTPFADVDGVLGTQGAYDYIADGDDSAHHLIGDGFLDLDLSFVDAEYVQDSAGDDSTDRLLPTGAIPGIEDLGGPLAAVVMKEATEGYGTMVYYVPMFPDGSTDGGDNTPGKVVDSSTKLGGVKGDDDDLIATIDGTLKTTYTPDPIFVRGDCNGDGACNIADVIFFLVYQFEGAVSPGCESACDVNDDGALNVADAVSKLAFLFTGGPHPMPPFPNCDVDPTPGGTSCDTYDCD